MKQRYLFGIMLLALLAGCRQMAEEEIPGAEGPGRILEATLEGGESTKTQLAGPVEGIYYPWWSETDELAVYADGLRPAGRFTLQEGAGTAKALFKGNLGGERLVALYPYQDKVEAGLDGDVLSLELPARQTYVQGSFADGAYPMLAVSTDGNLSFLNLCATLKVSLTGNGVSVQSIRFKAHDSKMAVSGAATVRTDFDKEPRLQMASGGSPEVVLECGSVELDPSTPTDFFLVVPPGNYKGGFDLEIKTFTGTVMRSTSSDIVFERSQLRAVPAFACVPEGGIDPENLPYNQIWYKTKGAFVFLPEMGENTIVSNVYQDGWGVITFEDPVLRIPEYAFNGYGLLEIHLPDCVEGIGTRAFAYSQLTSFRTPAAWKKAGENIFIHSDQLAAFTGPWASADGRAVILENGLMVACIVNSAGGLFSLPEGAKVLQGGLFLNGGLPYTVVVPEGVETLEPYCFASNPSLGTVYLPASLTEVDSYAFRDCDLDSFTGDCPLIVDGRSLVDRRGVLAAVALRGLTEYKVPEGVTFIQSYVFSSSASLQRLTLPSTLTNLWEDFAAGAPALEACYGPMTTADHHGIVFGSELTAVTPVLPASYAIPSDEGIISIGRYCFNGHKTVQSLTVPDEVTEIGVSAFGYMSGLTSICLPASLTSLGYDALGGCNNLKTVYLRSYTPPSYQEDEWGSFAHEGLVIYVPKGYETQYKNDSAWGAYAPYIQGYEYTDLAEPDYWISKDYSQDGGVLFLQKASEGAGINLVLLGDAFSDRQIASGAYEQVLVHMMEAFFGEEPYKSCRNLFNVYGVKVVSSTEGYEHGGQALHGWFGDGTLVGGDDMKCMDYARKVVAEDKLDNTLVIVAMNSDRYAGTCWFYYPSQGDYGEGFSVAYFPVGSGGEDMEQLVHHEAGGHGFAKLADEYAYTGSISAGEVESIHEMEAFGWWKNVDFTPDPSLVKWHHFLEDSRYAYDGLGVFQGGFTYSEGVWRPSENSIMRYNTGGFNAPSREAIWYRIHKLAYGDGWTYDYEEFVTYDAKNRKTSAGAPARRNYVERPMPPTHPPVLVGPRPQSR